MPQFPAFPFVNQFPSGLTDDEPIDPDKLATMALQLSVAADGRVHTDINALKNWRYANPTVPNPMSQKTTLFDPVSRRWMIFGEAGGEFAMIWTLAGTAWRGPIFPGGSPVLNQAVCSATNNLGVVLGGGGASSNTTGKLRETSNGGTSWTTRNIAGNDTKIAKDLAYSSQLALWFCAVGGLSGEADSGIYSSPDRITWTNRSTTVYSHIAVGGAPGSPVLLATNHNHASPGPGYSRSTDGLTWTAQTAPWTNVSVGKAGWSEELGAFFVTVGSDGIWRSTTGSTGSWTQVSTDNISSSANVAAFGRALLRGDGKASVDAGVTWFQVLEIDAQTDLYATCTPYGNALVRGASRDVYLSHQVGF